MKIFSIFVLLIYWTIIILAPVLAKDGKFVGKQHDIQLKKINK